MRKRPARKIEPKDPLIEQIERVLMEAGVNKDGQYIVSYKRCGRCGRSFRSYREPIKCPLCGEEKNVKEGLTLVTRIFR